jgi:hypothetical protein
LRRVLAAGLTLALGASALGADALAQSPPPERPRAAGAASLIASLEDAPVAVVGRVLETTRLDRQAFLARLRVEREVGPRDSDGATLWVAWEELAPSRAPRFEAGERVLVALEPLPGASIWGGRLEPEVRAKALAVADRGEAFLRQPSLLGTNLLVHYLALTPQDREGPLGAAHLAGLSARAEPELARSAALRLASFSDLDAALDAEAAQLLARALERPDSTRALQTALLEVAGRRPGALREFLAARTAALPLANAAVFEAFALTAGSLDTETITRLLETGSPEHRVVAARHASQPAADALSGLVRHGDPAEVRTAALERLVGLQGSAALEPTLSALADREPSVRLAAAQALGSLGADAVPRLRDVAMDWPRPASEAALVGLMATRSRAGAQALAEISKTHPDETVRRLADLALNRRLGERH